MLQAVRTIPMQLRNYYGFINELNDCKIKCVKIFDVSFEYSYNSYDKNTIPNCGLVYLIPGNVI